MTQRSLKSTIRRFRLGRSGVTAAVLALVLGLLGYPWGALGVWLGVLLFLGNLLLLHETARSLLAGRDRRKGRAMAIGASVGRLLLLGVLLAVIGMTLGREALLGACGGLLVTQMALSLPGRTYTEAV